MEAVKIAGLGPPHATQLIYTGPRPPPPVPPPGAPQSSHQTPTSRYVAASTVEDTRLPQHHHVGRLWKNGHEGPPYKGATPISPPMSRTGSGGSYPGYAPPSDQQAGGGGGQANRYMQQSPYLSYPRDGPYAMRTVPDRPAMIHSHVRRPTILGSYSPYSRDMIPLVHSHGTLPVSNPMDSKRIKLTPSIKPEIRQPLVIDTSENHTFRESTYNPQVEAISPTLPGDTRDESPLRSTKDDLLRQIEKVDMEIAKAETSIKNLRKKECELKVAAQKGEGAKADEEDCKEPKHQSIAQIIYAENRKKAEESHTILEKLMPPTDMPSVLPLYHQPSDTEVYQENKRSYPGFKRRLLEYFKKRYTAKTTRELQLTQTYSKLMTEWLKKVEKIENSKKHKEKVAKNRELFEKVFPELRKQREDKERFSRVGARVKSDAEMEEIMDGLQEQEVRQEDGTTCESRQITSAPEYGLLKSTQAAAASHTPFRNEDKKMRAYAVVPPILLEEKYRKHRYSNQNGLIDEPIQEYKDKKNINIWTDQEKEIFREKYLQHPKNFVLIASYLDKKSVSDCIQHYYGTKKKENYKMLVKRRMRRPRTKTNNQTVDMVVGLNSTGVTTRGSVAALQREQAQKGTSSNGNGNNSNGNNCSISAGSQDPSMATVVTSSMSTEANTSSSTSSPISTVPAMGTLVNNSLPIVTHTQQSISSTTTGNTATATTTTTTDSTSSLEVREKDKENISANDKPHRERKRKEEEKGKDELDTSEEENTAEHGKGGPHECAACGAQLEHYGQSRRVGPGEASQYGLPPEELPPNPRVCTACRCRAVRRRFTQCPIPTCPTPKWRGKRLRPFPSKWPDLPQEIKDPIVKEFQIPPDVTKCCSACHNRISRRLGPEVASEEPVDPARWSDDDVETLRRVLREVGPHWSRVAERLPSKTEGQCKNFYFNYKKKYYLDDVVAEYRKARGKTDGPPTVTDEEESGSSTSSCDETGAPPPHDSSDTHSAPSPGPPSAAPAATRQSQPPQQQQQPQQQPSLQAQAQPNNIDGGEKRTETKDTKDSMIKEPVPPPSFMPPPANMKEDYDSSTTASADEGQSLAGRDSPEVQHIPTPGDRSSLPRPPPASAVVAAPSGHPKLTHHQQPAQPPPAAHQGNTKDYRTTQTVREIIDQTIEDSIQAKGPPPPSKSPTITSLLERCPYNRPARDYPREPRVLPGARIPDMNMWSAVSDPRAGLPQRPLSGSGMAAADNDCEGLDLSVKKRDRSPPAQHSLPQPKPPPPPPMRGGTEINVSNKEAPPPRAHSNSSYSKLSFHEMDRFQPYQDIRTKSPSAFVPDSRALGHQPPSIITGGRPSGSASPHLLYTSSVRPPPPTAQGKGPKPSMAPPPPISTRHQAPVSASRIPLMKPDKPASAPHVGSITHGTPVNQPSIVSLPLTQSSRFEMMAKPAGHGKEGGSITQGTPMHHDIKRTTITKDGHLPYEPRPGSGVEIIPRPAIPTTYEREHFRQHRPGLTTNFPCQKPMYSDSQMASRQIIANDYLTSQQMLNRRGTGGNEKEARVSPRGRDPSPQGADLRDHRALPVTAAGGRIMDFRVMESRGPPDPRTIDHRDHRIVDPRACERAMYYPTAIGHPGTFPPQGQPPGTSVYMAHDARVSRPSPSPASNRDATPTPPTSEPAHSPRDFRSPVMSAPTPPLRVGVIQRSRPPSKPTSQLPPQLAPPKSGSPRAEMERCSPRHVPNPGGTEALNTLVDLAVARGSYPSGSVDMRRNNRSHHVNAPGPPLVHDNRQLEGLEKQLADSMRSGRPMSEGGRTDREKMDPRGVIMEGRGHATIEERRYYERPDIDRLTRFTKEEHRSPNIGIKPPVSKEEYEKTTMMIYPKDQPKANPSPKHRGQNNEESVTAATLIDHIIKEQISHGREGQQEPGGHSLHVVEADKRVRSPAAPMREKEVVTLEDGPDRPHVHAASNHKEGLGASFHASAQHHGPKSIQAHMDSVINRELMGDVRNREFSGDARKIPPAMSYGRTPIEITRADGRTLGQPTTGNPPVSMAPQYDQWKLRPGMPGGDKDLKERGESRSPHRIPQNMSTSAHHHTAPASQPLAPDERKITRIVQGSPRTDTKNRTTPNVPVSSSVGTFPGEPISPPGNGGSGTMPGGGEVNHGGDGGKGWMYHKRTSYQQPHTAGMLDYVRKKIVEVMRTSDESEPKRSHEEDGRCGSAGGTRHSRSGTPGSQPPSHEVEDPSRKKARLEGPPDVVAQQQQQQQVPPPQQRPPMRPRSTGGDKGESNALAPPPSREEVADSPQSDDMVIDETPRDHTGPPKSSGGDPGASKGIPPKGGDLSDRAAHVATYPPSSMAPGQYAYPYPGYRSSGGAPPSGGPANPSPVPTSTPGAPPQPNAGRLHGYEPNVEPVSDDD